MSWLVVGPNDWDRLGPEASCRCNTAAVRETLYLTLKPRVAYTWQVLSLEVGKRIFFRTENQVTFYMMACVIKKAGTGAYSSAHFQDEFTHPITTQGAVSYGRRTTMLLHNGAPVRAGQTILR